AGEHIAEEEPEPGQDQPDDVEDRAHAPSSLISPVRRPYPVVERAPQARDETRRARSGGGVVVSGAAAEAWGACGVDVWGWKEPDACSGAGAFDADLPPVVVDAVVARLAEQDPVGQVGGSGVSGPPVQV